MTISTIGIPAHMALVYDDEVAAASPIGRSPICENKVKRLTDHLLKTREESLGLMDMGAIAMNVGATRTASGSDETFQILRGVALGATHFSRTSLVGNEEEFIKAARSAYQQAVSALPCPAFDKICDAPDEDVHAVYFFTSPYFEQFIYIGVTSNLARRLWSHWKEWAHSYPRIDVSWRTFDTRFIADKYEAYQIAYHQPIRNKAGIG